MSTPERYSVLFVGENNGLLAERGRRWQTHPEHYERTEVVRAADYDRVSTELQQAQAALAASQAELARTYESWDINAAKIPSTVSAHRYDEVVAQLADCQSALTEAKEDLDESKRHNVYTVRQSLHAAKTIAEMEGEDPTRYFASMHDRIWFIEMAKQLADCKRELDERNCENTRAAGTIHRLERDFTTANNAFELAMKQLADCQSREVTIREDRDHIVEQLRHSILDVQELRTQFLACQSREAKALEELERLKNTRVPQWVMNGACVENARLRNDLEFVKRQSKMIDAPATCGTCGTRYDASTTGKLIDECQCGGRLKSAEADRDQLQAQVGELRGALGRFISKGTRDDGIDPEAYWIELSEDEYRSLQTLVHGDEQLSGSGGNMSAKTEDKKPPRELRCRHGILAGHCPDCPSEIDWSEVEHNERQQSTPKTQKAALPPAPAPAAPDSAKDGARLDVLLNENIDVTLAENGGWLLIDFRREPVRTTEHSTGRAAIDAAMAATPPEAP